MYPLSDQDIRAAIERAQQGDKESLEQVVVFAQGYIYNLALRMLQSPANAEDATQEILIKLITNLGQFRSESAFSTWMYRLAVNTLINMKQRDRSQQQVTFEALSQRIELSLASQSDNAEEAMVEGELIEEIRRSCTLGMLRAFDHEDRMALILGELLQLDSTESAEIMGIALPAYRQRLSRARRRLVSFVSRQCGIINSDSTCRCYKHVEGKRAAGLLAQLNYAQPHDAQSAAELANSANPKLDSVRRGLALFRAHPSYQSHSDLRQIINDIFTAGNPDA